MPTYSFDIKGYKSKKYKSLPELRRDYIRSDVSKKYGYGWVYVYMKRADGSDDYVGKITVEKKMSKYGIWGDMMDNSPYYLIDKNGNLRKIPGLKYPKRYQAYPKTCSWAR